MSAAIRRAALGAILTAPLASVPAIAASSVSPALARLIAEHDAHRVVMDDHDDDENPTKEVCREGGRLRALVAGFPSAGWADTMAKAACLARLWPIAEAEEELAHQLRDGHAYLDDMALGIACEVMRFGGGTTCA